MKLNHLPNAKYELKALQLKEKAECLGRIKLRLLILLPTFDKKVVESSHSCRRQNPRKHTRSMLCLGTL